MKKASAAPIALSILVLAGFMLLRSARAQDPPYDPHPLVPTKAAALSTSSMTTANGFLYVQKGSRVYQIKLSSFGEERPRVLELPE